MSDKSDSLQEPNDEASEASESSEDAATPTPEVEPDQVPDATAGPAATVAQATNQAPPVDHISGTSRSWLSGKAGLALGAAALVLLSGLGGFALGNAVGDRDHDRPGRVGHMRIEDGRGPGPMREREFRDDDRAFPEQDGIPAPPDDPSQDDESSES